MQVAMSSEITIGNFVFRHVNEVRIDSSWKTISDTAIIKLPNVTRVLEKQITKGMPVTIKLSYDGNLNQEFTGYVSSVMPTTPVEIHCEDAMWLLKQEQVSFSSPSVTLESFLQQIVPNATINVPSVTLSPWRVDRISKAQAIQKLKDVYGLVAYYRNDTLFVGLAYQETDLGNVNYVIDKNCLANNLVYRRQDDVKLKVKAISVLPDNTKIEVNLGDEDGEQRTLHFYNKTEAELRSVAQEKINQLKFDGYQGSITAFGIPKVIHSMTTTLTDEKYPERNGSFFIDTVATTYGRSGFRRAVQLGRSSTSNLIA